ncbi:WD40/YVTN/BNR-like repeat-containing protein [Haliscomenobacter sp.]|uniref:WD40/YVTN/BNR-like repeat-containing protein n=1 Tax=Haliscomenobacter sp. TaxID=2717303 RepID=UPI003BA92F85
MKRLSVNLLCIVLLLGGMLYSQQVQAQAKKKTTPAPTTAAVSSTPAKTGLDEKLYNSIQWRSIGPYRGGRSATVTGVPGKPNLFYFGSVGGGVWRTKDGGQTWQNISDGYFGGSIGAVAVSEYDNNIIYVGGGEKTVRGNVSYGYGMWRTQDAGKTWQKIGLEKAMHIPRIRIHPKNPDLVYAAVLGDLYKSSDERGVYRSKDGGKTWERVLFANADAGAVDLILDPNNPRVIYASTWRIRRTPYSLDSGGEGSTLWKSTDGGDTWTNLMSKKGLPKGPHGIIGVAVSPVNAERVWAIIEAAEGGVFRSDDGGNTWAKTNEDRNLRQRAWYYTRITADTKDENVVYVMNVSYHKSTDGGRTFSTSNAPHGDHHDLWIAPEDPQRMIIADDGGAQVSFDGGENWSTYNNQPTAQFYRVVTDNSFPYRIYGAQQDNSTIRIAHRTDGSSIGERDWEPSAGGESAHLAVDPLDNDIVYGGSYGGLLTRQNHRTKQEQAINVWPDNPMGAGAEAMKYRFQWNYPIFFSPHDPKKLYVASDRLHVTTNGGQSWETISPDLTRNDKSKQKSSGGPITQDNTSVEYYCTVFAACESPYEKDLLWTGSDDGLLHVSRDGGKNWSNVTPPSAPANIMFNSIDADPFNKGGVFVAGTSYKSGDYKPYLFYSKDYGKTWTKITNGIPENHFTRVVRADPKRAGLLYAGTETGMYISFDNGANWQAFQLNLPIVPITDLTIKNDNLIAATQGRSFWMIDDLTPLHQLSEQVANSDFHLYQPIPSYRMEGGQARNLTTEGTNHPGGVTFHYYLKQKPADSVEVKLTIMELNGTVIKEYSTKAKENPEKLPELKQGGNTFNWNMRYADAKRFEGMIFWAGGTTGPKAVPGRYKAKLSVGGKTMETEFEILKDPRSDATMEDIREQFNFLIGIRDKVTEAHQTILDIRNIRKQLTHFKELWKENPAMKPLMEKANDIDKAIGVIENELYQTKNRSGQDPLNYPIKLTNKLAHVGSLSSQGDYAPTKQAKEVKEEMTKKIDDQLGKFRTLRDTQLPEFNRQVREKGVDAILLKEEKLKS